MDTISEYRDWAIRDAIHRDRHISILQRQSNVFSRYIDLCKSHPANSQEFEDELMRLHNSIISLLDEMKEVNELFSEDCSGFIHIVDTLKEEIEKIRT